MLSYLCAVPIPLYIIYELLIRLNQFNPSIGSYTSHSFNTTGAVIITTHGKLRIRKAILNRQFKDPELVSSADLILLTQTSFVKKAAPAAKS